MSDVILVVDDSTRWLIKLYAEASRRAHLAHNSAIGVIVVLRSLPVYLGRGEMVMLVAGRDTRD